MNTEVSNRIAEFRAKHGLSQTDLAHVIGVSRKTISTIETERFTPSVTIALKIAATFNVPVESLFELKQDEDPAPISHFPSD